jgi:thioredoxin reductase (NADPH)
MPTIGIVTGSSNSLKDNYDIVIIGAGPAGLTAGIYAARARINSVIIEKNPIPGGQIINTENIENYPGFDQPIGGFELMQSFKSQAENFGVSIFNTEVVKLSKENNLFTIEMETSAGNITAKAVIISSGASPKLMGAENEKEFIGKGISFCATCDGALYKDKVVSVIGGGDSALEEALFLTRFAKKVYLIHRRDKLRAAKILQERAFSNEKIEPIWSHVPVRVIGKDIINALELKSRVSGEKKILEVNGIFVYVGLKPNTQFIPENMLELDERGFIVTDCEMRTNVAGLFAAGDVRAKFLRQVSTAVGDGATAQHAAERFLEI